MASVSNNLSVLNIRGEDSVFLGAKFPVVCPKKTSLRLQALYIPTKNPVRLPHASKVNRCPAIDRRPVVKKQRNLVNYLTSISLFNARKFVVCIFEISDEDLAPTE